LFNRNRTIIHQTRSLGCTYTKNASLGARKFAALHQTFQLSLRGVERKGEKGRVTGKEEREGRRKAMNGSERRKPPKIYFWLWKGWKPSF